MRPLRLEVSGLTCFREKIEIDFSDLTLVAVEGPTGAGKSSLLDAMILALYGIVPRMGAQNLGELISHGRSGLSVTLDFAVRGSHWRVARTVNRTRPSQAMLSELVLDGEARVEKRRSNGVLEVKEEVRQLLGIDVAAFQQAVILPQGRFQEFLQSRPGDRRKILGELLGFQVYALMRGRASEIATRLGAEVDALARQLTGELALASEALMAELELQLGAALGERDTWRAVAQGKRAALVELERAAAKCLELKAIDEALVAIEARTPAMEDKDARARRAREVAPVLPLIGAAEVARGREGTLGEKRRELAARVKTAEASLEGALEGAREAEHAALAIAGLRVRIAQLDEARARFEQRDELAQRVARLLAALALATADEATARTALGAAEAARGEVAERLAALEREVLPAVDPHAAARWEGLREVASRLRAGRQTLAKQAEVLVAALAARAAREAELDRLERERKLKEHAELAAEEALETARAALAAAEHEARVALVREHVHAGEACPVCEQVVTVVPPSLVPNEVSGLREKVGAQRNALESARGAAERARSRVAEARAKGEQAEARAGEMAAEVARLEAVVAADEALLGEVVAAGAGPIEERFREGLEGLARDARRAASHEAALQQLRLELARAGHAYDRCVALLTAAVAKRAEVEAALAGERDRLAALETALADVGSENPKKERAALERAIAHLDEQRKEAETKVAQAREALAGTLAEDRAVSELEAAARAEATAARAALDEALAERRLGGVGAARAAALEPAVLAAFEAEAAAHRAARSAKLERRAEVVRELGPLRAGPDEVEVARGEVARAAAQAEEAAERVAILGERLRQGRDQLARAGGVRAEHEAKLRQLEVYRRVADDLKTQHFQEYLLEEVVADLVRGASERLFTLSGGRYRLASEEGGGFAVQDLDHAGERRSTDTLSGGETFLASLAMALELSEQIRAKAGRVDLDCIFIDEGFGALDPETLETVTEAVEGLQRPGRLVGIITHVAELAQRMPERLVVEKAQAGSTVRAVVV